ncbi:MAG TPA: amino acid adenylation domain-containing protein [Acidobacteriaceae bacterium]|nr:amino acid adenylation domain-containing protein [Acidobacteriaceae bacterium]
MSGAGVNNDGSAKMGYAAPSIEGQTAAIVTAHESAAISSSSIGYVECHGTGTPLGDPIEVRALEQAFAKSADVNNQGQFCTIGSVKSAVGHLDIAAGVTGLIKTALVLQNETIPPTLHFSKPNPNIQFAKGPFRVNAATTPWPRGEQTRRAGVSAFGVGGTNVHLVLEEAPVTVSTPSLRPNQLFVLSAAGSEALTELTERVATRLENDSAILLEDAAYTLATGRRESSWRVAVAAGTREEAAAQLRKAQPKQSSATKKAAKAGTVFLFPGQGSQYPHMGAGLYKHEPVYRQAVDQCATLLVPMMGLDLRDVLFPTTDPEQAAETLRSTRFSQPAIFVTEYATAQLWMEWGITPSYLAGHSIGEFVAACLAGVFTLEEALRAISLRASLMQSLEAGAMTAVRMSEAELQPLLGPELSLAAINSANACVASGPFHAIDALEQELTAQSKAFRRLKTSHAFHSAMMRPALEPLTQFFSTCRLSAPRIPITSSVTGEWLTPEQATSPKYWATQCIEPVRFHHAMQSLMAKKPGIFLEVGAGNTLAALAKQAGAALVCTSLPGPGGDMPDTAAIQTALGAIWASGANIDWSLYYQHEHRRRQPLPTYPFQRKRHWVDISSSPAMVTDGHIVGTKLHDSPLTQELQAPATEQPQVPRIGIEMTTNCSTSSAAARTNKIGDELQVMFEDLSGVILTGDKRNEGFLELGFDSLFLTQVSQQVQRTWGVKVTFRQMLEQYSSLQLLAEYLASTLPPETVAEVAKTPDPPQQKQVVEPAAIPVATPVAPVHFAPVAALPIGASAMEALMQQQLTAFSELMKQQLQTLQASGTIAAQAPVPQNGHVQPAATAPASAIPPSAATTSAAASPAVAPSEGQPLRSSPVFATAAKAPTSKTAMTDEQRAFVDHLAARISTKTAASKAHADKYRKVHADPRSASGFRPEWKEMAYSMVVEKSAGSKLWDIDGNEYIDLVNGFGATMFGHGPAFVTEALKEQADLSVALGPQTPLAGETAQLICELTGNERVTFCNTGSEAVMAAMRIARTVTGRDKVVLFAGDYHGQFDEVLVKGIRRDNQPHTLPAAPGIPRKSIENMIVLEYGAPESLAYIEQHANELAAVLVEPVQSRHPNLQPKEFLTAVRAITEKSETALIFDEVVTGFRIHPGGAQAFFGVRADMATYGKVAGGGVALGVLAGKAKFMDALDGGEWQFGDDSYPSVGMTFFAGTFVRHPLTMAATYAALKHIRAAGMDLYNTINGKADKFKTALNEIFTKSGVAMTVEQYGSIMYFHVPSDARFGSLLYFLLREKGIYILEGFPLYLTTAHSDADLEKILTAIDQSIAELQSVGLLPGQRIPENAPSEVPVEPAVVEIALTDPQLEIMLAAQAGDEASCAFNECFSLHLQGALRLDALEKSFAAVIATHDALRMTLNADGDRMLIHQQMPMALEQIDLSGHPAQQQEVERKNLITAEGTRPFDLKVGPLIRVSLMKFAEDRHELIITAHHMVCDGWSVNLIVDELGRRYSSLVEDNPVELDKTISFREYAASLEAPESRAKRTESQDYWVKQFEVLPEIIDLPTDRPRGSARSFNGATYFTNLSPDLMKSVRQAGASQGATLFATLLAAWQALLSRLSGGQDIVTLIPSAAQSQLEDVTVLGHCVNLLPIRSNIQPDQPIAELIRQVKRGVLDAYDHQHTTLGSIVQSLKIPAVAGRLPLSEVQFNLERIGGAARFSSLTAEVRANGKQFVNFDLFLNIVESSAGLRLECDYNTDLYDQSTIDRWMRYYRNLLESLAADPQVATSKLALLGEEEKNRRLFSLNATEKSYPSDLSIPALISRQVDLSPNSIAVEFYGRKLTRKELDMQSNQICSMLRNNGIGSGQLVGIYIERSTEMLIAILGVLKAGAAYVPLDPLYPKERVAAILEETEMAMLLTLDRHLDALPASIPTVSLDRAEWRKEDARAPEAVAADSLAYVIFTSGSTGKPKGVEITHRSVVNLLLGAAEEIGATAADRLLAVTTLTFDIAAMELLLPLVTGATLVIARRDDAADGTRLIELMRAARINVLQATPITWRMLLDAGFESHDGLKMLCGGESWNRNMATRLLGGGGRLWNMYGPTETTIWSSVNEIKSGSEILIGPPLANTQFYVLDSSRGPVPAGVTGELFIAGEGVARGYYKRPELTAASFTADPFRPGSRMYKTGDLVRQHEDGRIQYLRRADHQIKLRGFRIELEEIERAIIDAGPVAKAIVALKMDQSQDPRLVAYIQANPGAAVDTEDLRTILLSRLPEYMVPPYWLTLDQFPLTANRKIDRKALPEPEWSKATRHKQYLAPSTPMQQKMAAIWSEVMRIEQIGIEDSLLELGADSLKIFQISARSNRSGLKVSAKQLMVLKTINAICADLEKTSDATEKSIAGPVMRVSRDKYRVPLPASDVVQAAVAREVQTIQ